MDDLLQEFLDETTENLAVLDAGLVALERRPDDPERLREVFRLLHTIKGTCGFLGLARLERAAHAGESVLSRLRDGAIAPSAEAVSLILECLDRIRAIVAGLAASGAEPPGDDGALIARIEAFIAGTAAPAAPAPTPVAGGEAKTPPPQGVRIGIERLDALMAMVGELVLARNQLRQAARARAQDDLCAPLQRLDQVTAALQEAVMRTRMQPIGTVWAQLPRLVRDLSHELGKRIELSMAGADTELDRQVLEIIRDPLTHMVRNCADHGIETPGERRAAGKPEVGRITLSAFHRSGHVIVEVSDDGRGLATDRIRERALQAGLASAAELAAMTPAQVHQLIFRPGLTTAEAVTSVSGRGVGMDVVKTKLDRIGGSIDIRSVDGRGTTFTARIPLTLAIVPALVVGCAGGRFALPQLAVRELVRVSARAAHRLERVMDRTVLRRHGRLLPVVGLHELLALPAPASADGAGDGIAVVLQAGGAEFGIAVDGVFDAEEIVVKPVAPPLRGVGVFCGTAILGDGGVVMILDPNGLAAAAGQTAEAAPAAGPPPPATGPATTALLVVRSADGGRRAVPLALVERIEEIDRGAVERVGGRLVVQHRGRLMPLLPLDPQPDRAASGRQPVLVLCDGERRMGLMVEDVLDIVEEAVEAVPGGPRPGSAGTAVVGGRATELIDAAHYLRQAFAGWVAPDAAMHHGRTPPAAPALVGAA